MRSACQARAWLKLALYKNQSRPTQLGTSRLTENSVCAGQVPLPRHESSHFCQTVWRSCLCPLLHQCQCYAYIQRKSLQKTNSMGRVHRESTDGRIIKVYNWRQRMIQSVIFLIEKWRCSERRVQSFAKHIKRNQKLWSQGKLSGFVLWELVNWVSEFRLSNLLVVKHEERFDAFPRKTMQSVCQTH